jgi:hypothetical protein
MFGFPVKPGNNLTQGAITPFLFAEVVEGLDYHHIYIWCDDPESSGAEDEAKVLFEVFSINKEASTLRPGRK